MRLSLTVASRLVLATACAKSPMATGTDAGAPEPGTGGTEGATTGTGGSRDGGAGTGGVRSAIKSGWTLGATAD